MNQDYPAYQHRIPPEVWYNPSLSPTDKLVFAALLRFKAANNVAHPHQKTIAKEANVSLRSVKSSIAHLVKAGLLATSLDRQLGLFYHFPSLPHTTKQPPILTQKRPRPGANFAPTRVQI